MPELDYKTDNQADERLNPADAARDLYKQEREAGANTGQHDKIDGYDRAADGLDDHPISAGSTSNPKKNIDDAAAKEREAGGWINNYRARREEKQQFKAQNLLKKKGPMWLIVTMLIGGGGGMTLLFSPAIAIVQIKEAMFDDVNDQLGAMELRSDHLLRTKLKTLQVGASICTNGLSFRCKLATMPNRQVQAFRDNGFKIEPDEPDRILKRTRVTSITFPDGTVVTDPNELRNHLTSSPEARSAIRKAFNPKFAGVSDKISAAVFGRFKTNKSEKLTGATDEDRDKAVAAATAGQAANLEPNGFRKDSEGREYVIDDDGKAVYKVQPDTGTLPDGAIVDEDRFNSVSERARLSVSDIADRARDSSPGKTAVGSFFKSGLKGLSLLGATDTMCTVYNLSRAVAAAAKVSRALQLFQFAMVGNNLADSIKAGTATPEQVTYFGDKLMATDPNQYIEDETSIKGTDANGNLITEQTPNPNYGANAFDSPGYAVAAYNDSPILTSSSLQYAVGGGLSGKLSNVLDYISEKLGGRKNIRSTCKVVQSWWARAAGLLAGIVSAVGSFGVVTGLTIAASVAIGFAIPYLKSALADIAKGNVVGKDTAGVGMGDAMYAGNATIGGGMAMGHGMMPADSGDLKTYLAKTRDIRQQYIAADIYEAKSTPLDVMNQYSFLGSAIRKINPALVKSTSSISGALTSIPSFIGAAFTGVIPTAGAYQEFNPGRFDKCKDAGYDELGIDGDIFCNVRYYKPGLDLDPDAVALWMEQSGNTNEDGSPKSDAYKDWIKYCTEREDGWGETSDEGSNSDKSIGLICVKKDKTPDQLTQLAYFGTHHMDYSINDTMENGYTTNDASGGAPQSDAATPEMCESLPVGDAGQIACKGYQFDNYGYKWGGGHGDVASAQAFMTDFKADKFTAGKDHILDCSGFVRMAIFEATGVDIGGMGTGGYPSYAKFKEVPKESAKAGDILWTPVHTEIVVKNNVEAKKWDIVGAHNDNVAFEDQIGPTSATYDKYTKVYRFQP